MFGWYAFAQRSPARRCSVTWVRGQRCCPAHTQEPVQPIVVYRLQEGGIVVAEQEVAGLATVLLQVYEEVDDVTTPVAPVDVVAEKDKFVCVSNRRLYEAFERPQHAVNVANEGDLPGHRTTLGSSS